MEISLTGKGLDPIVILRQEESEMRYISQLTSLALAAAVTVGTVQAQAAKAPVPPPAKATE